MGIDQAFPFWTAFGRRPSLRARWIVVRAAPVARDAAATLSFGRWGVAMAHIIADLECCRSVMLQRSSRTLQPCCSETAPTGLEEIEK